MTQAEKPEMKGFSFIQHLQFGEWPLEEVEEIIANIKNRYSNSDEFELLSVDRGGYRKCSGGDDHEPCDNLIKSYGAITFIRKGLRKVTKYESV